MSLTLTSTAFADRSEIPMQYTSDGENISPPLSWAKAPPEAKSLALIVEDPDAPDPAAPERTFVHWVLYNLPAEDSGLKQDTAASGLPTGAKAGSNDWSRTGYGGPRPPVGRHRYFFRLYALDTVLHDLNNPDKATLEEAMKDHIVDSAVLMGTYQH
jgi:Raf kinase inhibitor-like YbhB/YbcL family protein